MEIITWKYVIVYKNTSYHKSVSKSLKKKQLDKYVNTYVQWIQFPNLTA